MSPNLLGIGLSVLGGVLVGNCMLPLKRIRTWPWECTWLIFSVVSLALVPWAIAWLVLPNWPSMYLSVNGSEILPCFLFGIGWGIAQVLFGLAVIRLGMALGFTLVVGLGTVFGTLIPFFARQEAGLMSRNSIMLLSGCLLMVIGVGLSGWAGKMREIPTVDSAGRGHIRSPFLDAQPVVQFWTAAESGSDASRCRALCCSARSLACGAGGWVPAEPRLYRLSARAQSHLGQDAHSVSRSISQSSHGAAVDRCRADLWSGRESARPAGRLGRLGNLSDHNGSDGKCGRRTHGRVEGSDAEVYRSVHVGDLHLGGCYYDCRQLDTLVREDDAVALRKKMATNYRFKGNSLLLA